MPVFKVKSAAQEIKNSLSGACAAGFTVEQAPLLSHRSEEASSAKLAFEHRNWQVPWTYILKAELEYTGVCV
jgi:hypothetical protein